MTALIHCGVSSKVFMAADFCMVIQDGKNLHVDGQHCDVSFKIFMAMED